MLRLMTGYDWASTAAQLEGPGLFTNAGGASPSATPVSPRTGAKALQTFLPFGIPTLLNPAGSQTGGCIGTAFQGGAAGNRQILGFQDSGLTQCNLLYDNGTQRIKLVRQDGAGFTPVTLWTSVMPLIFGFWYYVELEMVFHNSAGEFRVWVDNNQLVNQTGVDTTATGNASFNQFQLGASSETTFAYDDTYMLDNVAGDGRTARLGSSKVMLLLAVADSIQLGDLQGGTPSTGDDQGAMVDDTSPDDDSTYNKFTAAGQEDSYHHVDLSPLVPVGSVIHGVAAQQRIRKTDAGGCQAQVGVRAGGTNYYDSPDIFPTEAYQVHRKNMGKNPNTTIDWTISDVDNLQSTIKRTA